jgi:uncharacterized protein
MTPRRRSFATSILTMGFALFLAAAWSQGAPDADGSWSGSIATPGTPLEVVVHLTSEEPPSGTIDIPAQGARGLPLDAVTIDGRDVTFRIAGVPGEPTFRGSVTNDRMEGTFTQGGMTFDFALERGDAAPTEVAARTPVAVVDELLGDWSGVIGPGTANLTIGVTLAAEAGEMRGTYTIPMQAVEGTLTILEATDDAVAFTLDGVPGNATFRGVLEDDRLAGSFMQGGFTAPLELERSSGPLALVRPQEPVGPLPYREEFVTVTTDVTLAGTLTLPEGDGPFPALVLLTGSGPQDRDETLFGHRPFLVIADHLTRAGYAVLRLDDRGVGESEGDFLTVTYEDFVGDAVAAVAFLADHPTVDASRVGLLGHSEGGFIAPVAAARDDRIAFLVTLAGPSVPGIDVLLEQNRLFFELAGEPDEEIDRQLAYLRALHAAVEAGDVTTARQLTRDRVETALARGAEGTGVEPSPEEREAAVAMQLASLDAGWFRDFLTFDPRPFLAALDVPLLAIYGTLDLQVPSEQSAPALRELADEAGLDVTIEVFDGLNHLLQPATTGGIEEYGVIETTIAPEVLERIVEWLDAQVR